MTVLTFPSNPTLGQVYDATLINGLQYAFDGIKWVVETATSTSEAVSNSAQDRVAPMFVNGVNNGISFAYNAGTNTMTATVTSTVGNALSNNNHEFTLESDGTLTLDGDPFVIPTNTNELTNGAGFITSSALTGYATELYVTTRGYITSTGIPSQTGNDGKYLTTDGTTLSWGTVASGTTDRLTNGLNEVVLDADGILTVPSGGAIQQRFTWTRAVQPNLSTASAVIWTALYDYISSVKLTIQLEANETGDATGWHSQVCEAVVASRGYANSFGGAGGDPVMTVYGVTYTSTVPLVTFTVQRNPTTKQIEIVGTKTAACDGSANFRIHSVEMATRD